MPVESFIPLSKSKLTVEKPVKEKPKSKDLIKIEKPGRVVPESEKEEQNIKKRKTKRETTDTIKFSNPKRDSILIVTEKPQAAIKIAEALGNPRKYTENNVSYYELLKDNKKIIVASAVGHLFNLTYSKGQTGFPIFNLEWVPSYQGKRAGFTKNYYNLLKKLSRRAKEVIISTDYDIEGEVIGWNVLRFICKKDSAKRMKYSTLTKPELLKAYENPMPELDWGQAYAGETRHKIDWLYGINLSRALMSAIKTSGSFKILSIGRVQGPALKIIVDREREIQDFKPEPYWQVLAHTNNLVLKHPKDIFDKEELKEFEGIEEGIAETIEKEEFLSPPHPFDLTSLQREAHAHHRISPSNTLKIAQSLYLDGIISYPRTSSQKIPKEIEPLKILEKLEKKFPEAKLATRKNPVEGKKSDPAHPSIYPTGEFKTLRDDEQKLYNLIVRRFISCFMPDAKTANKKITLTASNPLSPNISDKKFTASGLQILEKSWLAVYPVKLEEHSLPNLSGKVKIDRLSFPEKETQPPKRYTPASLITLLEKKNLGTKATRSSIVDTLFDRGYLDGKSIEPTPLGKKLIDSLEKYSPIIIDENLTRSLEQKMEEIQKSKGNLEEKENQIIESVKQLITDISKEFKVNEINIGKNLSEGIIDLREIQRENSTLMPCPTCKSGSLQIRYAKKLRRYFVGCSAYPKCTTTFSLPPNSLIKKTDKLNEEGLPILQALRKGKRPWEFVFDPNWKEKQENKK
ncbi:MAG: DNA topoisomerase I [Candidatus Pacearchaeota archaeon]|nr:DNA topoisomerase I [Candidatus Pacearchaeota archaeon]